MAAHASDRLIERGEKPVRPILHYGTRYRMKPRHALTMLFLLAAALLASWWGRIEMRRWFAYRGERATIRQEVALQLSQAKQSTDAGHWRDAQVAVDRARLAADSDTSLFKATELEAFANNLDQAQS
jgi:hypothetical protein